MPYKNPENKKWYHSKWYQFYKEQIKAYEKIRYHTIPEVKSRRNKNSIEWSRSHPKRRSEINIKNKLKHKEYNRWWNKQWELRKLAMDPDYRKRLKRRWRLRQKIFNMFKNKKG